MKLLHWLEHRAALTPDQPGLITDAETLSFRELAQRSKLRALDLLSLGLKNGDRVAVLLPNDSRFVELLYGAMYCGATLVPIHARLNPEEIRFQLEDSESRFLVFSQEFDAIAQEASLGLDSVQSILLQASKLKPEIEGVDGTLHSEIELEDIAAILYTSGTTGRPKGAMLSYGNFFWSAVGSAIHLGSSAEDRWLACMPLYHVAGIALLIRSVLAGNAVVLHERFDEAKVKRSLEEDGIRIVSLVPAMFQRLLDHCGEDLRAPELRCILLGGAASGAELLERAAKQKLPVAPTYGLTECASQVATLPLSDTPHRLGVGAKPLLTSEVRIVDAQGSDCDEGVEGEIWVRGPSTMRGYLNAEGSPFEGEWFKTGDIGVMDGEGYLRVLERRTDLIVSGGENIYPREIEAVLIQHPAILEAGVTAIPDDEFGQSVGAWLVSEGGASLTDAELDSFCREHLAGYKVPRRFTRCRELPRTASGKLLRRKLLSFCESSAEPCK